MFKFTLILISHIVLQSQCLYDGESCTLIQQNGICIPLPQCQHLLTEIKRAGSPMPEYMRMKMQKLTCGFHAKDPMRLWGLQGRLQTSNGRRNPPQSIFNNLWLTLASAGLKKFRQKKNAFINLLLQLVSAFAVLTGEIKKVCCMQTSLSSGETDLPNTVLNPKPSPDGVPTFNSGDNTPNPGTGDDIDETLIRISDDDNIAPKDVSNHPNLSLLPTKCGSIGDDRILGGQAAGLLAMPWMVLLSYISRPTGGVELNCAGTLINEWYVLTAAHCVKNLGSRRVLDGVVLGEYDLRTDPDCDTEEGEEYCVPNARNVTIDKVIAHPGYRPNDFHEHDIALLRLSEPADLKLENIKPICLPLTSELQTESLVGLKAIVTGWGRTENEQQSPVLLKVELPVISQTDCLKAYSVFNSSTVISERKLCAGGVKDSDSCSGDSGGPIMFIGTLDRARYVQRGIVSFGTKPCAIGRLPGVYTNIAYYMDWILDNIQS